MTYGPFVSPDGRFVLTTREAQPRLWDLEDRVYVGAFPNDEGNLAKGATGEDALRLATIVGEYALLWNLNVDEWPEIACRAAGRNLTQAEWEQFGPDGEPYRATCPQWPALG